MPESATAIGVDIGGTNLRVARVSRGGQILDRYAERIGRDPSTVIERIVTRCRGMDHASVVGIGIGVPGRVDARRREVLSGGYLDLAGAALVEEVERALHQPVVIDNDCSMALVAEMASGAAKGASHAVMFTIGTGIGGAVALDGKVVRGGATAGQLGHLTVDHAGLSCACGRRGCVETTSSGTALGRLVAEAGLPKDTQIDVLFEHDAEGRRASRQVLDKWALPLRCAIDSMVAAVNPQVVVLGGGLGPAACRALARAPALSPWYQCPVVAALLGDDAGVIGAALSALAAEPEARGQEAKPAATAAAPR